ncbi:MAG: divalent metal cation transporter [Pyrinomonadaceae bacterium]|nr:divalent metal cation transporter [Pyrinomonadaceae bacterium]
MKNKSFSTLIIGAAFLMATSAVGPGFLTQTTFFTQQLAASFGFVILLSVILDIFAQLNIWRILVVSEKHAQDIANETIYGSGYFLAGLIVFGGLVFNIGNIAGCGLGMNVLFGVSVEQGAIISAIIAIIIFLVKEFGKILDWFAKVLGFVMIALIIYVVIKANPPIVQAVQHTILPTQFDALATVTLVGGTVGGYITFAGGHRLLDAGIRGKENLDEANRGAVTGILLTAVIRFLLFLASFGVVALGLEIAKDNPPASVFQNIAGDVGYKIFGVVMWCAAITSVVGAAYTSVSFIKTFDKRIEKSNNLIIVGFIIFSSLIFLTIGRPVQILLWAGTINGFILPISLALMLIASQKISIVKDYKHPIWLQISGWFVVLTMTIFSVYTIYSQFQK